jgi:protein-S-isoprenylcysteine O-methyltransferase Ste14
MSAGMFFFLFVLVPLLGFALAWLGYRTLSITPLSWLLIVVGLFFGASTTIYSSRRRSKPLAIREEHGDRSFWLILPGFLVVFFGAPLEALYLPSWQPPSLLMQIAGMLLVVLGTALLFSSVHALGRQFTGHVHIQIGHRLVASGPYRIVRHPGYLGYLLLTLGVAAGYASLVAAAAIVLLLAPGLIYRMQVEERLLLAEFGDEYLEYTKRTRRLIPGVW